MKTKVAVIRFDILLILSAVILTILLMAGKTPAMPPHPDIQSKIDRGETQLPVAMKEKQSLPGTLKLNAPAKDNSPKLQGPFRALCILVDFSDKQFQTPAVEFDTLIFENKSGNVRDYYGEVSYGQLDLITVNLPSSLGVKRAPQTYAYYVDDNYGIDSPYPNNSQKLCEDLVDMVDAAVDFSQYDNDGDGYVDVIMITHAGPGAEFSGSSSDIWSHKWSINPRVKDGVSVFNYTIMPEYWSTPGDMTIGVYCHELGHAFGLPDLYDTDGSSNGTGYWSLMSTGSWNGSLGSSPAHPDAWSRIRTGWVAANNITSNQAGVSIPEVENNAVVYRLWTSGAAGNEYFLVENRQKTGFDAALPGSGLLIWHIDETVFHNNFEWYPGYTSFGNYLVALEQADNLYHLEKGQSLGDLGDPFPGSSSNPAFSPVSSPNSDSYGITSSLVSVTNISASDSLMTANFAVSFAADNDDGDPPVMPRFALAQNYPNPFNPTTSLSYTVSTEGDVDLNIYNILGEFVNQVVSGPHQPGSYTVKWDGTDNEGNNVSSGVYLYELVNEEQQVVRKMLLLK
jgi:immune inhibitor A